MFLLIAHFGTLSFSDSRQHRSRSILSWHGGFLTAIALLLVLGATGKSAQIPLYVWLPDAMEGPTPVSALIHAATMVTAGVYMVVAHARASSTARRSRSRVVAIIGAATAFFAATIGIVQTDIKRVLAYSTISQLGYMFLACGVAAYSAAIFHLVTHAFFKALLFLAAGSVIHALGGEQDMREMGGLRKQIPVTFWTMTIGCLRHLRLAALRRLLLARTRSSAEVFHSPNGGPMLWAVGLITAVITSFYMFRLWYMTFFGHRGCSARPLTRSSAVALDDALLAQRTPRRPAHAAHRMRTACTRAPGRCCSRSCCSPFSPSPAAGSACRTHSAAAIASHTSSIPSLRHGHPLVRAGFDCHAHRRSRPQRSPSDAGRPQTRARLTGCSVLAALLGWLLADTLYRRKPQLPQRWRASSARALRPARQQILDRRNLRLPDRHAAADRLPLRSVGRRRSRRHRWRRHVVAGGPHRVSGPSLRRIQSGNIRSYAGWLALGAAAMLLLSFFGFGAHRPHGDPT